MTDEYPHHDEGLSVAERIHYVVTKMKKGIEVESLTRFTGLLAQALVSNGLLSEAEVMQMLDEVVNP